MKIYISILLLLAMVGKVSAQDTVKLAEKDFYKMSTTAFGNAIVYSQNNVQLKKAGNYKASTMDGDFSFKLNKNFYVDGPSSRVYKNGNSYKETYKNGILTSSIGINSYRTESKKVDVKKEKNDYLITITQTFRREKRNDSTIMVYLNEEPLLKEKFSDGTLILRNDRKKETVNIYDKYGNLEEKHFGDVEEKYLSNGEVYFKKILLKNRTEEYRSGKLSRTFDFVDKPNSNDLDKIIVTDYDKAGNKIKVEERMPWDEVAPEYMIFKLNKNELEGYKAIVDVGTVKTKAQR